MSDNLWLAQLKKGGNSPEVCVKILSLWNETRFGFQSINKMIVADITGRKIQANVSSSNHLHNRVSMLEDGDWICLYGFDVVDHRETERNTEHVYEIIFSYSTRFYLIGSVSGSRFFKLKDSYVELLEGRLRREFPIDVFGIIKKLSKPRRIPYVCRNDDQDFICMAVTFTMVDHDGNFVNCCAIGSSCDDFMTKWSRGGYDLVHFRDKVFCVLQFWRIWKFGDEISLLNGIGCSKVFLKPTFPELHDIKYVSERTEPYYEIEEDAVDSI